MTEQTKSKVTQILFKGFDGKWEEKTLGETTDHPQQLAGNARNAKPSEPSGDGRPEGGARFSAPPRSASAQFCARTGA